MLTLAADPVAKARHLSDRIDRFQRLPDSAKNRRIVRRLTEELAAAREEVRAELADRRRAWAAGF